MRASAEKIVNWVAACLCLKQQRQAHMAASRYTKIVADDERGETCEHIGLEVLRKARVRLGIVCSLILRRWWSSLPLHVSYVYCWAGASPQRRGADMLSSCFDLVSENVEQRRLFPLVELAHGCKDGIRERLQSFDKCSLQWGATASSTFAGESGR